MLSFPKTLPASGGQDLSLEAQAEELTVLAHWGFACLGLCILHSGLCIPCATNPPLPPILSIVTNWEEAVGSLTCIRQKLYMVEGLLGQKLGNCSHQLYEWL